MQEEEPTFCECGNMFMPDAVFCRKCGLERSSVELQNPLETPTQSLFVNDAGPAQIRGPNYSGDAGQAQMPGEELGESAVIEQALLPDMSSPADSFVQHNVEWDSRGSKDSSTPSNLTGAACIDAVILETLLSTIQEGREDSQDDEDSEADSGWGDALEGPCSFFEEEDGFMDDCFVAPPPPEDL